MGHAEPRMDGGQGARQMPVPGHGERRPRHPEDQGEQRAQSGHRRTRPHHRGEPRNPGGTHRVGERRGGLTEFPRPQYRQEGHRNGRVHDQREAEGQRDRPRNGARRIPDLLTEGRDTGVPGEGEEQQTAGLEHPAGPARQPDVQPPGIGLRRRQTPDHHGSEDRQDHTHDRPCQPRGLLDTAVVHRGQQHHGGDRHGVRLVRPDVRAHGERHRRAGGRLADHEGPAREVAPEVPEPLPPVHVRAARGRVPRGEAGRRGGVAVGDRGGGREPQEQPGTCRVRGGCQSGEDPGSHHRAESDDHGVAQAERAAQFGAGRCCHGTGPYWLCATGTWTWNVLEVQRQQEKGRCTA